MQVGSSGDVIWWINLQALTFTNWKKVRILNRIPEKTKLSDGKIFGRVKFQTEKLSDKKNPKVLVINLLPRKLISIWKPPSCTTIFKSWNRAILTAFSHRGWSNVMHGVCIFAIDACSITYKSVEFIQVSSLEFISIIRSKFLIHLRIIYTNICSILDRRNNILRMMSWSVMMTSLVYKFFQIHYIFLK